MVPWFNGFHGYLFITAKESTTILYSLYCINRPPLYNSQLLVSQGWPTIYRFHWPPLYNSQLLVSQGWPMIYRFHWPPLYNSQLLVSQGWPTICRFHWPPLYNSQLVYNYNTLALLIIAWIYWTRITSYSMSLLNQDYQLYYWTRITDWILFQVH